MTNTTQTLYGDPAGYGNHADRTFRTVPDGFSGALAGSAGKAIPGNLRSLPSVKDRNDFEEILSGNPRTGEPGLAPPDGKLSFPERTPAPARERRKTFGEDETSGARDAKLRVSYRTA